LPVSGTLHPHPHVHAVKQTRLSLLQPGFDHHHTVLVDHRVDLRNPSLAHLLIVGKRADQDSIPGLHPDQLVFQDVELHLGVLHIEDGTKRLAPIGLVEYLRGQVGHHPIERRIQSSHLEVVFGHFQREAGLLEVAAYFGDFKYFGRNGGFGFQRIPLANQHVLQLQSGPLVAIIGLCQSLFQVEILQTSQRLPLNHPITVLDQNTGHHLVALKTQVSLPCSHQRPVGDQFIVKHVQLDGHNAHLGRFFR